MILYINTTPNNSVEISLKDKNKFIAKKRFSSNRTQAEKLLPGIAGLLKANRLKLSDLKGIEVANRGGSFTSLRIGVITANSLGYALRIPVKGEKGRTKRVKSGSLSARAGGAQAGKFSFNIVRPEYESEPAYRTGRPKITIKNNKNSDGCGKDV